MGVNAPLRREIVNEFLPIGWQINIKRNDAVKAEAITAANSCLITVRPKVAPVVMLDTVILFNSPTRRERERKKSRIHIYSSFWKMREKELERKSKKGNYKSSEITVVHYQVTSDHFQAVAKAISSA